MGKSTAIKNIPLLLVTGFLGSGKTSLLKSVIKQISPDIRIGIVQNEFAPGKTDSEILSSVRDDFNILEINNGSVFCACLLDTFIDKLDTFIDQFKPSVILLESTGLADPISMGQILQSPQVSDKVFLSGIISVVDLLHYKKSLKYVSRVRHQIQMADLIILNKTDLESADEKLMSDLKNWNPGAEIKEAQFGHFSGLESYIKQLMESKLLYSKTKNISLDMDSSGRPDIRSAVIRTNKKINKDRLISYWSSNKKQLIRIKGFVCLDNGQVLLLQTIFDQISAEPVDFWSGPTELIAMGYGLHAKQILKDLYP